MVGTLGGWDQLSDWNAGDRIDVSAFATFGSLTFTGSGPGNVHVSGANGFNINVSLGEVLAANDFIF